MYKSRFCAFEMRNCIFFLISASTHEILQISLCLVHNRFIQMNSDSLILRQPIDLKKLCQVEYNNGIIITRKSMLKKFQDITSSCQNWSRYHKECTMNHRSLVKLWKRLIYNVFWGIEIDFLINEDLLKNQTFVLTESWLSQAFV